MANGVASIRVTGNVDEAVAALEALGLKAEETAEKTDAAFGDAMASKLEGTGNIFSKLGNTISGLGLPFGEAFSKMGDKISEAETEGKGFSQTMMEWSKVGAVAFVAAAAVVAGESIHLAMNYQKATANLSANAGITTKAATAIGSAFLDTAGKSTFSAQQIMDAYGPVAAQLGETEGHALNAKQAMTVMSAAMDLAEGTGSNLAATTSSLATIMQAYGLKVGAAASTSDLLFNVSTKTGVSMGSLTSSLQRLHTQMGANTPSLQQTGGLLLDLTTHGETGRAAMSTLSTALNGILMPTTAAKKAQQDLGVSFENAQGQMLPLADIIGQLHDKLAGMGDVQAEATLKSLGFGTASTKLLSIIQAGPAVFDKDTAAASQLGTAHAAAGKQANTMHGQLEILKSSAEDLGVKIGEKLIPILAKLVTALTKVISWLLEHKAAMLAVGAAISLLVFGPFVTLIAALALVALNWKKVWADIKQWTDDAVAFLRTKFGTLIVLLLGPLAPMALLALHWQQIWALIKRYTQDFVNFFTGIPGDVSRVASSILKAITNLPQDINNDVIQPIRRLFKALPGDIISMFKGLGKDILHSIEAGIPGGSTAGKLFNKALGVFELGGMVPGSGPQLAVVHGGEYVLTQKEVGALQSAGGAGSLNFGGGGGGSAGGGGDILLQLDGRTFAQLFAPYLRTQWLQGTARNAVKIGFQ